MDSMRKPQTDEVARGPGTGESMAVRDFILLPVTAMHPHLSATDRGVVILYSERKR